MLLVGFRHSDARIRQTYDGPLIPVRYLDKRRLVGRILTVIFNQIRESNVQQIQIPFHRNQTVILCLLLFEQQIDVIIWMSTQNKFPSVQQQFVQPDFLHLDMLLLIVGLRQIQQAVYQLRHSASIEQHVLHCLPVLLPASFLLQRQIQLCYQGCQRRTQFVRHIADKHFLRVERYLQALQQSIESRTQFSQFIFFVFHRKPPVNMQCRNGFCFFHNIPNRFQRRTGKKIPCCKQQRQSDNKQDDQRFLQLQQIIVAISVVSNGRYNVVFPSERIAYSHSLILANIELHLLFFQNTVYHGTVFLDNIVLYRIVIKHLEVGRIDSHFHFVDKLLVVQINRLHGLCIYLILKKQMRLCHCLTFQVVEKRLAARMFAYQINQHHAQQKNGRRNTRIL